MIPMNRSNANFHSPKEGAALLAALAVLMLLSLIVGSFYFEVDLEARLASRKRKLFHAQQLARSGIEYAKAILDRRHEARETEIEQMEDRDGFMQAALHIQRGLVTTSKLTLGQGTFSVTLESAEGGRNINLLARDEWIDLLEMANVPSTEWDALIDCLEDWIDEDDLHRLNGAESDDPFYTERGYPVKNGALDSVDELLLIKGWSRDILYGRSGTDESDTLYGIASMLTVWGDGKVNINTAGTETLLSFSDYEDWELETIFEARKGADGEHNTLDDGIRNLAEVGADANKFKLQSDYVKVTSTGESHGVKYRIQCILRTDAKTATVVFWEEGQEK